MIELQDYNLPYLELALKSLLSGLEQLLRKAQEASRRHHETNKTNSSGSRMTNKYRDTQGKDLLVAA